MAEQRLRIEELDGLRGVAILLVLWLHYFRDTPIAMSLKESYFLLWAVQDLAWMGVDLFFVISGFLVARVLIADRSSPGRLRSFYVRRALRILPLYYLLVLFVFALDSSDIPLWSYAVFLQNYWISWGSTPPPLLGIAWSLAVEEHFYLFAPLVVWSRSKRMAITLAVAMTLLSMSLRHGLSAVGQEAMVWTFPFGRMDGLGLGVLGALVRATGLRECGSSQCEACI